MEYSMALVGVGERCQYFGLMDLQKCLGLGHALAAGLAVGVLAATN